MCCNNCTGYAQRVRGGQIQLLRDDGYSYASSDLVFMSSPTDFHIHHTSSKLDNPWKHNTSLKQATVQEIWLPQIYERKLVLNKAEHGRHLPCNRYMHTNTGKIRLQI